MAHSFEDDWIVDQRLRDDHHRQALRRQAWTILNLEPGESAPAMQRPKLLDSEVQARSKAD